MYGGKMSNKSKFVLRFFGIALILVAMLDLIPVGVFSNVGAVYAEGEGGEEETPEIAETSAGGTGPTSDTPEQLGLPEDTGAGGYQDDCTQPGNTCEKEEGDGLGDVNEVGEGETFEHEANVVVIKAGNNQYFYKPDGPSCNSLSDPYCVFWGATSITVVRNLEDRNNKDISNIQFWSTDDDDDTGDDDDDECQDSDQDGVCDSQDNCVNSVNPNQADVDNDGIGDACDEPETGDDDDDCQDTDLDGVCDTQDNCVTTANADQLDTDLDGIGDVCDEPETGDDDDECDDADLDGVCDSEDNCVDAANADQMDVDDDGIGDVCDSCIDVNANQICDDQESGDDDDECDDADLDGVCDSEDNCVDAPNADQMDVDDDGIGDVCDSCIDVNANQICDDQESGDDDDDEEQRYDLILDPYCVEMDGGYFLAWEIHNPNTFNVNAKWMLDGNPGGGSLAPGVTFIGYTEDGPATHTLNVAWEFGKGTSSSAAVCAPVRQKTPTTTFTASNPPDEVDPIIPVTGVDLGAQSLFRRLLFSLGTLLFGLSMVVRGTTNKMRK
jgi:hypothetical protein